MGFALSASVNVREFDLTLTIPAVATSIGALVGNFQWGPCDEFHQVVSEKDLALRYGLPDDNNFQDWFSAANFLSYSNNLQLIRVIGASALNSIVGVTVSTVSGTDTIYDATQTTPTLLIKNKTDYDGETLEASVPFYGKYPGVYGNKISVSACTADNFDTWADKGEFDYAPTGTEIWVLVRYDGQVVERFYANLNKNSVADTGGTNYLEEMINRASKYLFCNAAPFLWKDNGVDTISVWDGVSDLGTDTLVQVAIENAPLVGGAEDAPGSAEYIAGWNLFNDDESVDINLCMVGGADAVPDTANTLLVGKHIVENVCQVRKDCMAFVSPALGDVVGVATSEAAKTAVILSRDTTGINSSYGVMDCNYKYQYDRYNDVYRWVPLNADVAGTCARTDNDRDPWWSPGGLNRGQIKNVVKLAFNPTRAQRDDLYVKGVNPIVSFKGEGTVLWGDKTLQTKPSAFDRINVRRLFIVLEKAIATASKYTLFEFNDRITRNAFKNMVEPFLRDVKGRRGVQDYLVVCDETNNTGEVIDRNEFVADIYIKPNRAINFIYLNFVAVKSGVAFEEVLLTNEP